MPRSTLKLPKRSASTTEDVRAPTRKPIRGGSEITKHAAQRRAHDQGEIPAAPPSKRKRSTPRVQGETVGNRVQVERAEVVAPPRQGTTVPAGDPQDQQTPPAWQARPGRRFAGTGTQAAGERPGRTYPQRGIAGSSGARAFPPPPKRTGPEVSQPAPVDRSVPVARPAEEPAAAPSPTVSSAARSLSRESPRLAKRVSELANCSRREADEWIESGWVSVDGVVVTRLGARVSPKAKIMILEAASQHRSEGVTILFNKPCGLVDTEGDDHPSHAASLIRADNHWAEDSSPLRLQATQLRGLALAGRLDADEAGMLVFTQEGSVARRLTGGDTRLEKEYHVRVAGELIADGLAQLRHGLSLGKVKLLRAQVSWLSEQQLRFVLHESRKRQIQGMCEQVGLRPTAIKRVRIGSVSLGKLGVGQWRYLRADERF